MSQEGYRFVVFVTTAIRNITVARLSLYLACCWPYFILHGTAKNEQEKEINVILRMNNKIN